MPYAQCAICKTYYLENDLKFKFHNMLVCSVQCLYNIKETKCAICSIKLKYRNDIKLINKKYVCSTECLFVEMINYLKI